MSKSWILVLLVIAGAGGWYFVRHYQIQGLDALSVAPRGSSPAPAPGVVPAGGELPAPPANKRSIRIATFHCGPLDEAKMQRPQVVARLAQVIRRFDVVALQDIQARNQSILLALLDQVNAESRYYHYVVAPGTDRDVVHQYSAVVFDRTTIQVDPSTVGTVADAGGGLRRPPLVASFRARGPDPSLAFTFTLINVHVDAEQAAEEMELLDDVFRAVRDGPRNEDDIILLGNLEADPSRLGALGQVPGLTPAITGLPTTTRGDGSVDNLLFDYRAVKEYTARSGVVDLMREMNLSLQETLEMTAHLPVWAEFSVFEGGQLGQLAEQPRAPR